MLFRKIYGVDLGSSTIKVYSFNKNKSYMEKNIIAAKGRKIIAVGNEAYEMFEKSPEDIHVEMPMTFGMIANIDFVEIALYSMLQKIDKTMSFGSEVYFAVPMDLTAVDLRAYYTAANGYWMKNNKVFTVEEPIAEAIALGIPIENSKGSMIVNIGGQSTGLSVIADGRVIISKKIPVGGRQMNESICNEIRKKYNLNIGTRTARRLKTVMGRLDENQSAARKIVGVDCISGLPREEAISSYVVNGGIALCVNEIIKEMKTFLERIPPQVAAHLMTEGIYLTGGSARIPCLDKYLSSVTGFSFRLSNLYEASCVRGLEKIIKNKELQKWARPMKQRKL